MVDNFDQFVRDSAQSPYLVFFGFILTALPIFFYLIPRIFRVLEFIIESANTSFKTQLRKIKIKNALAFRRYYDHFSYRQAQTLNYLQSLQKAIFQILYLLSSFSMLVAFEVLTSESPLEREEKLKQVALYVSLIGFIFCFSILFEMIRPQQLKAAFEKFADRRKLPYFRSSSPKRPLA